MPIKILAGLFLVLVVLLPLTIYFWKKVPILLPGMLILLVGISSNMIVTCTNGYKMSVVVFGDTSDSDVTDSTHSAVGGDTRFIFLADHMHVASPIMNRGYTNIMSVGDILIYMGSCIIFMYCILLLICHRFQNLFPKITEMMKES